MLTFDFRDKKILIAGIGGIGCSVANLLGQLDAELFVIDIDTGKMEYAQKKNSSIKQCVYCDFSNVENIEDTINTKDDMDKFVFDNRFRGLKDFEFNQDMWDKGIVLTITLY